MIFIVFDRDALLETLLMNLRDRNRSTTDQTGALEIFNPAAEVGQNPPVYGIRDWNRVMSESSNRHVALDHNTIKYLDQFPPFNITISMANEYGHSSTMRIYGVQIINEGSGMSIDDIVIEKACSFIARGIEHVGYDKIMQELNLDSTERAVQDSIISRNPGQYTGGTEPQDIPI